MLFWVMTVGAAVIWLGVMASALYAVLHGDRAHSERRASLFIVYGGVVIPAVTLTVLVGYGLSLLPKLLDLGPHPDPRIVVSAEQWWWRVTYRLEDGRQFDVANEVRLPVGSRTAIAIRSPDVVHSFWVPALAGKVDAIPGHETYLAFEPTREGVFRGVCAEYCGTGHAKMLFDAVVMSAEDYENWLEHQAQTAMEPSSARARRGALVFEERGCGACHTIRGTSADGMVGPDLTHVASRRLVAGVVAGDVAGFRQWLAGPDAFKPGVHMPAFSSVSDEDLSTLATYLNGLR